MSSISPRNQTEQERLRPGQEKKEEDGGYGWVVVIASFLINMVVDGISYSFGILLEPMKMELQSNTGSISLVGSTLAGMTMLTGPVSAACCNRFGTRKTCILGGLISSVSLLVSSYCNTTISIILSYGLLGGFGLGLMYVPAVVCVSQYFNKQLSLATGISVCGSGAGTFLFAPLVAKLVGLYGWRGCNRLDYILNF
ncbi:monocarboxylate transporter 14 [Eurytemora carolleeae]|uniref:monocarboxylate transporter 14 n=1 Tax=Eurytemora carolleeae TaxID=1294199 RepID=UPI000C7798B1|nr:monocarboxylate transporter 14 [Eurytemora carolleeae]|eukprot:XP_023326298.1 monocarboxylate transporter 14-like [Eurytemora affinis]